MLKIRQLKKQLKNTCGKNDLTKTFLTGLLAIAAIAGGYIYYKRKLARPVAPGKKINIDIRYETEKDADATLLAQNLVKIIRIILSPLESKIAQENAELIFVFGGEYWEVRVKNGSSDLKQAIRDILEAKEW